MEFKELILKRRSVREYAPTPVPREVIDQCLEAARLAPSACNSQPWSFIVVDDSETLERLVKEGYGGIYKNNKFVKSAPVIVIMVTEKSTYVAKLGGMIRNVKYNLIDIGIAGEHFALQAEELGIGTCWLGWFNEKAVKKILGLPKSTQVDVMFTMGYPKDTGKIPEKIRKPLDKIRTFHTPQP